MVERRMPGGSVTCVEQSSETRTESGRPSLYQTERRGATPENSPVTLRAARAAVPRTVQVPVWNCTAICAVLLTDGEGHLHKIRT